MGAAATHLDQTNVAAYLEALRLEKERRQAAALDPSSQLSDLEWVRSFRGRARAFAAELIGPTFLTADSWAAWRAFLSALFGEPFESDLERQIYRECTGLIEDPVPGQVRHLAWLPIGRRGGKSRQLAFIAVCLALCYDWSPYLAPGETGFAVVLAAQRKQAQAIMGYVKAFLDHPRLVSLSPPNDRLTESVSLTVGITIEVVTASIAAVRSRTVVAALLDEIAFWRTDDGSANPDVEILNAIEPATATIPGAMILGASSPYAKRGVLWENFKRYYGARPEDFQTIRDAAEDESEDGLDWDPDELPLVWRASTRTMNPLVPERFIRAKYRRDPAAAAAEYGAEFRSDVDAYLTREALEALIEPGLRVRSAVPFGLQYRAFVDASGGMADSMTLGVGYRDPISGNAVLALLDEVHPPFVPEAVVTRFKAHLDAYKVKRVTGDRYGGEWVAQAFQKVGITYDHSELTATQIYVEFLPLVTGGRCDLLDSPRLVDQLSQLERRSSRSTNREIISHPPGGHDDLANSAAGVLVLIGARPVMQITSDLIQKMRQRGELRRAIQRVG